MGRILKTAKIVLAILLLLITVSCSSTESAIIDKAPAEGIVENQSYYDLEDVVLYLKTYGELPPNYLTKKKREIEVGTAMKGIYGQFPTEPL